MDKWVVLSWLCKEKCLEELVHGRGSPQRVDTAQNIARAAAGGLGNWRLSGTRNPLPLAVMEKHAALHYWLFYTSRKREVGLHSCKGWGGVLVKPPWMKGTPGAGGVGRGRSWGILTKEWMFCGLMGISLRVPNVKQQINTRETSFKQEYFWYHGDKAMASWMGFFSFQPFICSSPQMWTI